MSEDDLYHQEAIHVLGVRGVGKVMEAAKRKRRHELNFFKYDKRRQLFTMQARLRPSAPTCPLQRRASSPRPPPPPPGAPPPGPPASSRFEPLPPSSGRSVWRPSATRRRSRAQPFPRARPTSTAMASTSRASVGSIRRTCRRPRRCGCSWRGRAGSMGLEACYPNPPSPSRLRHALARACTPPAPHGAMSDDGRRL